MALSPADRAELAFRLTQLLREHAVVESALVSGQYVQRKVVELPKPDRFITALVDFIEELTP